MPTPPSTSIAALPGRSARAGTAKTSPVRDLLALTEQIEKAIAELQPSLPKGVEATVLFRQRDFIDGAIGKGVNHYDKKCNDHKTLHEASR